jgi:predicted NUDIX family NTP pyrophosphohydrolase
MVKLSAGLLVYRLGESSTRGSPVKLLLVHPGGPYWASKDDRAWSIPKGEYPADEDPWVTAQREFREELGLAPPDGPAIDLGQVTQSNGKRVQAWAVAGDLDVSHIESNAFELEWPPRSGSLQSFPEVDRADWFTPPVARRKLVAAQAEFVDRLVANLVGEGIVAGEA